MTIVRWSDTSRADLRAIHAFIARDSRIYARQTVERIKKAVERLRRFPGSGTLVRERDRPDLREILVGNYRVIYWLNEGVAVILTVVHASRQLADDDSDR
jgi:plasmid stabilization system protein ParE